MKVYILVEDREVIMRSNYGYENREPHDGTVAQVRAAEQRLLRLFNYPARNVRVYLGQLAECLRS